MGWKGASSDAIFRCYRLFNFSVYIAIFINQTFLLNKKFVNYSFFNSLLLVTFPTFTNKM